MLIVLIFCCVIALVFAIWFNCCIHIAIQQRLANVYSSDTPIRRISTISDNHLFSSSDESLVDDGSSGEEKEEVRSAEVKVPEPRGKSPVRSVHTKSPAASAPKSNSRDPRARAAAFKESQRLEAAKAAAHTARVNRASIKSSIRANELNFDNDEMESRMSGKWYQYDDQIDSE